MTEAVNPPSPAVVARVGQEGLSDLAVSPFGLPMTVRGKEVRVAWVGRTSTEEHQDPRQSLLRQLERSKVALPESWVIVAHFYDVESGRMDWTSGAGSRTTSGSISPSLAMVVSVICWPRRRRRAVGSMW